MQILIAVSGEKTLLDQTLSSIQKSIKPDTYKSTIVVENGQKFDAEAVSRKYKNALNTHYLFFPRGNKSAALNFGITQLCNPEDFIFFTDDDAFLEEQTLVSYEKKREALGRRYFFGGETKVLYEKPPPTWLTPILPPSARGWEPSKSNNDYTLRPRFLGFNWAAYAGDIQALGLFNENLGPGTKPKRTGQEWNMQERMLHAGFKAVFVENALVTHHVPKEKSSFQWFLKRRFQDGFGRGLSFVEEHGKKRFPTELVKFLLKALVMFPFNLLSFSKRNIAKGLGDTQAGLGRIKGYLTAYFSR
ncbi:glycosyltransferase [Catalinimonas alkaloidigena]|uniref:glycosyltransferase n=1 Tax=Catalinimonas alkaloidigena TaxID=1075417 RepID=UPI002405CEDF|nr:glycosyltransferase family 2 protein [Catalinimonas alkaloidigena]